MSFSNAAPSRRRLSSFGPGAASTSPRQGDDLSQSLRQLSLSAGTPTPSKPSSPLARSVSVMGSAPRSSSVVRSASVASTTRRNSSTPRSPLPTGRESRAGTPSLLRKASINSLHSASGGNSSSTPGKTLTRRASANNLKPSSPRSPLHHEPLHERPPPPTAADIARQHFVAELQRHASAHMQTLAAAPPRASPTVVILHDACYGHRFSRPRTSRANLGTIVERPERIQACAVGVAAAYVRLGGRHADGGDHAPSVHGGRYMPHPQLDPLDTDQLPDTAIPFRIHKTARSVSLLSPAVTNVHGVKWMEELKIMCDAAEAKLALNGKELQRPVDFDRSGPHGSGDKPGAPVPRLHEGDLYLCEESLEALQGALGGVCEAVDTVFGSTDAGAGGEHRRAFVAIRPPGHHCSSDWPSGFCWINNVHVGIMHGILTHGLTHAAIVDIDLHHGDGSQAIAWAHNTRSATATKNTAAWKKTSIGYFSLHDINSFPCEAGDDEKVKNASLCVENAHGQTVWNVHLEPWKTEAEFWALYEHKYTALLAKLRAFLQSQAAQRGDKSKAAVFISAGFDASEWESAGMQRHKVNVPTEFYARFTRDVVEVANDECGGRVISVLEGGYSDRALFSGVLSHVSGLAGAEPVTTRDEAFRSGLGFEMGGRLAPMKTFEAPDTVSAAPYDPTWWAPAELDRIEKVLAPPPPPAPKAERAAHPSTTYSSPTASSQARKASTTLRVRRSTSGLSAAYSSPTSRPPTPPPPPPPEVPWTVAMHELSKLLIPSNRSTGSCTVEDLAADATRARRERQVLLGGIDASAAAASSTPATPQGPKRVSQRERKPVKPFGSTAIKEEAGHGEERKARRKTVSGTAVSAMASGAGASAPAPAVATPARGRPKQSRRLSTASALDDDLARGQADAAVQPIAFAVPPVPAVPAMHARSSSSRPSRPSSGSSMAGHTTRPQSSMSVATGTSGSGGVGAGAAPPSARNSRAPTPKSPRKKAAAAKPVPAPKPHVATPAPTQKFVRKVSGSRPSSRASSAGAGAGPSSAAADMDKLTTGMRKIKINVVTAAQKEERERARRQAEEAKRGANEPATPRLSATPVARPATAGAGPVTPLAQTLGAPTLCLTKPEPEPEPPANERATSVYSDFASDDHSPLLTPSETTDAESLSAYGDAAAAPAVFIPYQPEGTPQRQTAASASAALHWMPPNEINTPAPLRATYAVSSDANSSPPMVSPPMVSPVKMKRADLPVFTSTSTIPFAPPGTTSRPPSSGQ